MKDYRMLPYMLSNSVWAASSDKVAISSSGILEPFLRGQRGLSRYTHISYEPSDDPSYFPSHLVLANFNPA